MARAIAADTRVALVAELTPGTTPASPAFTIFRATGENLEVGRKLVFSSELNGSRGERAYAMAAHSASGAYDFEWSDGTLDTIIESVMRNTWTTNAIRDAKTPRAFTLETTFEQGGTDTFKRALGAEAASLSLNMRAGEKVTGTVGWMGRSSDYLQSQIAGATYAAGNSEPILTGASVGAISMAGLTLDGIVAATINLNNNLRERYVLGALAPSEVAAGKLELTGSLSFYLDSGEFDILRAYADGVSTSLDLTLGTVTLKKTRFNIPNIVLFDVKTVAESAEGDVMLTCNFRALQASSLANAVLEITRDVV
jgi:hypothetical protein